MSGYPSRRHFLRTAIAGSAGLGALGVVAPSAASKPAGRRLAIGTYGLQSMPVGKAIELVADTGFDAVEITVFAGSTGDRSGALISRESRERVRKTLEDRGLRLCALMADLKPEVDDNRHHEQLSELNGLIQLAHDLAPGESDPPLIQTILGGKRWEESRHLFRDRLASWNQLLADQKGYLSIKPHRSHAMSTPSEAAWLLEQLGHPRRLGMVYDYSHYAFREPPMGIGATVAAALPITSYVAVKDAARSEADGKVRFALAGESGSWDHAEIVKGFLDGGYEGDFCCEVSSQIWRNQPGYDPVAATRTCYQNLRRIFDRAGA